MRKIEFRGKKEENGEWAYGYLTTLAGGDCLVIENGDDWDGVIEETVGQYIGLKDKNGTKIFEGDIVITEKNWDIYDEENKTYHRYVIKFTNEGIGSCGCCYEAFSGSGFVGERVLEDMMGEIYTERCHMDWGCEIIGNIYDNPELL